MANSGPPDHRLELLVGGVALAGAGCLVWALANLPAQPSLVYPAAFAVLVAAAGTGTVYVETRSQRRTPPPPWRC